jgi:hypothetical protein
VRAILDTSPDAAAVQLEAYRRMGPEGRLRVGLELTQLSRSLLAAGIRARHPEYGADDVHLALVRAWLGPALFRVAYPGAPELEP